MWRVTVSLLAEAPGFAYLEPRRHIPSIADLGGPEATSVGPVVARVSVALRAVTQAEQVYIYIFGNGIDRFRVHLAPYRSGDALSDSMIRGEIVEVPDPRGTTLLQSRDFPPLPRDELLDVVQSVAARLA